MLSVTTTFAFATFATFSGFYYWLTVTVNPCMVTDLFPCCTRVRMPVLDTLTELIRLGFDRLTFIASVGML